MTPQEIEAIIIMLESTLSDSMCSRDADKIVEAVIQILKTKI